MTPPDKVGLTLLQPSGERKDIIVNPKDTISKICKELCQNWPDEFPTKPLTEANLKVLLRGKFLEANSTVEC
jgi:hypothetical protein